MKLCKVYSNQESLFHNVEFHEGLNVILGQITDKSETEKDTHNLGKTLLISVIDFLLLKGVQNKNKFFLTKGGFEDHVFFGELLLNNGKHLVIRRGVDAPTKISFKVNDRQLSGFQTDLDWDEKDLSFDKAKDSLNRHLGFDVVPSWPYRKAATYFLRSQNDFRDVFKLDKFKSRDRDWKPFMFDLLGFNGAVIQEKYELEDKKREIEQTIEALQQEADINVGEKDKIQGLLDIKTDDKSKIENKIDKFNFYEKDTEINKELVEEIDRRIQLLNTQRYGLSVEIKNIDLSLSAEQPSIDIDKLQALYRDVQVYFPDKLVNDYKMLLQFNESITAERNKVLRDNLVKVKQECENVTRDLREFETEKEDRLSYLTEKDSYSKFKEMQKRLAQHEADIIRLRDKLEAIDRTSSLARNVEVIEEDIKTAIKEISSLINEQKHSEIRRIFNSIIEQILSTNALLSIRQNNNGNVEFEANIQNPTNSTITAEDHGMTYRKLLCMAFDLSVLIHYSARSFYRFVYHDGALEALDDRKKLNFLSVIRKICEDYQLQYILTIIDSDLPKDKDGEVVDFPDYEVCLKLHDRDDSGKLFKKSF